MEIKIQQELEERVKSNLLNADAAMAAICADFQAAFERERESKKNTRRVFACGYL